MLFGSEADTVLFIKVGKAGEKWGAMEGKLPRKQRDRFRLVFCFLLPSDMDTSLCQRSARALCRVRGLGNL